jgi:hypothetical protein
MKHVLDDNNVESVYSKDGLTRIDIIYSNIGDYIMRLYETKFDDEEQVFYTVERLGFSGSRFSDLESCRAQAELMLSDSS